MDFFCRDNNRSALMLALFSCQSLAFLDLLVDLPFTNCNCIISIRWGGVARKGQIEGSRALACGRQQKAEESTTKQIRLLSSWADGMVQGPCSQEVPSAREGARSAMREAKLGRQLAPVMRSYK